MIGYGSKHHGIHGIHCSRTSMSSPCLRTIPPAIKPAALHGAKLESQWNAYSGIVSFVTTFSVNIVLP